MQSRRTLEIVHNFGRARGHGPHLHVYKAFAATMGDASDDEVAGNAAPRDGTVHSARMENVFVNFDAFAANFGGCFVNFVGILTLYDTRNAMRRSQCEHCAASERQNMHFHFANNRSFISFRRNEFGCLQTGPRLMKNIHGSNQSY